MYKAKYSDFHYTEERPLFASDSIWVDRCSFRDGESPLKESKNIKVTDSVFAWKYPLWYCSDVVMDHSRLPTAQQRRNSLKTENGKRKMEKWYL